MKRAAVFMVVFIAFIAFIVMAFPFRASAEEELYISISSELDDAFSSSGLDISSEEAAKLDFSTIACSIRDKLAERITAPIKLLGALLSVVIFTSFIRTSGVSSDSGIYDMVCVLSAAVSVLPAMVTIYEDAFAAVSRTGGFISVYVPVYAGLTAAVGALVTAGTYNTFLLLVSELIVGIAGTIIMPAISVITSLAVTGSVFADSSLEKLSEALKKAVLWIITTAMTLLTGFVTMKCTIAAKAEGAISKTVKLAVSGAVPIVGGAVSDAFSTVCGSFDVIRCSVGAAGSYAIILIMLPPVLEIAIFRTAMRISSGAAELFSCQSVTKLLNALDSGLAIAQSLLVCFMLMFILCTGVLLNCCGE